MSHRLRQGLFRERTPRELDVRKFEPKHNAIIGRVDIDYRCFRKSKAEKLLLKIAKSQAKER